MRSRSMRGIMTLAATLMAAGALGAAAKMNVGALQSPNPDAADEVFLHIVSQKFPQKQESVSAIFHELENPVDQYTTLAFIAGRGNTDIKTVHDFKKKDHGWFEAMKHFGVTPGMLFQDVPTSPVKPYSGAYGSWRKNGDKIGQEALNAKDIVYWAGLQSIAAYSGKSVGDVVLMANNGETLPAIAGRLYRAKTGKGTKGTEPAPAKKKG